VYSSRQRYRFKQERHVYRNLRMSLLTELASTSLTVAIRIVLLWRTCTPLKVEP
jgi:hypothetical protein